MTKPEPKQELTVQEQLDVMNVRLNRHDEFRKIRISQINRQVAFIAIGGILALSLLAYRSELIVNGINDSRRANCLTRLDSQTKFNESLDDIGRAIVTLTPDAPATDRVFLLQKMIDAKEPLPNCNF